jgi:hypothetical protein
MNRDHILFETSGLPNKPTKTIGSAILAISHLVQMNFTNAKYT